jgi:hypothetical protein
MTEPDKPANIFQALIFPTYAYLGFAIRSFHGIGPAGLKG